MEKWQFAAEIESAMSSMDYSQISELATAIMDSWAPADATPKVKQEEPEQPMVEEVDPLDSFSFWDGENFYCHPTDANDSSMQAADPLNAGGLMPPLLEYEERDEDFLQPTLAQLNSPPEFDFFPPFSPPNSSYSSGGGYAPSSSGYIDIKPSQQPSSLLSSSCPPPTSRLLPAHFLPPACPQNSPASDSSPFFQAPLAPPLLRQQAGLLSSSAPPDVTMATYFPKQLRGAEFPGGSSPSGRRSVTERSLSGFSSLSLSTNDDESIGSFVDDEDEDDDYSSDEDALQYDESDDLLSSSWPLGSPEGKGRKHRFFWQYNLQSRGARAQQILPKRRAEDPHVLDDAFDPVFSEECSLPVKHSGKARRGDGNDLTPDPRKLFTIGVELRKLNRLIYNVNPAIEGGKPLSRKEKNKLASRVCRLKKKAQHEANKIKLFGLQQEHKKLLSILSETRELLRYKIENLHDRKLSNCSKKLEAFLAANEPHKVAGNTTSFVNEVLEKVAKGESDGGLSRL